MFNPMPDISQKAIIIFYVCVVISSSCDYNVKGLCDRKKSGLSIMVKQPLQITCSYALQVQIATFEIHFDYTPASQVQQRAGICYQLSCEYST